MSEKIVDRHESYGAIQISRLSVGGKGGRLFGSHLKHNTVIALRIKRSEKVWNLHHHWYHPDTQDVVEVFMSPAQFAEVITSLNIGEGVPCTIQSIEGRRMSDCPDENVRELIENDFKEDMDELTGDIQKAIKCVADTLKKKSVTKGDLNDILNSLHRIENALSSNIPFVQQSFNTAIDKTVHAAKVEVEAFVQSAVTTLGKEALAKLGGEGMLPTLTDEEDDNAV